jgi:hypothetical protein
VHKVTVDIEEAGAVRLRVDDVVVPDLVVKGSRFHRIHSLRSLFQSFA